MYMCTLSAQGDLHAPAGQNARHRRRGGPIGRSRGPTPSSPSPRRPDHGQHRFGPARPDASRRRAAARQPGGMVGRRTGQRRHHAGPDGRQPGLSVRTECWPCSMPSGRSIRRPSPTGAWSARACWSSALPLAQDEAWALDQLLRQPGIAAVLAWIPSGDDRAFRRLQLAAEAGGGLGLLVRPAAARRTPCWASVRLAVQPLATARPDGNRRLCLKILHCRSSGIGGATTSGHSSGTRRTDGPGP